MALPEYAFIGRSNVGKSSLINMITAQKGLAQVSGKPGKTRLINYFEVDASWYLVDLPGYGFAKVGQKQRAQWQLNTEKYLLERTSLMNIFLLIDSNIPPQKLDLKFAEWLGQNGLPFSLVFTKADRIKKHVLAANVELFKSAMLETWEELPPVIISSSEKRVGREELLDYIQYCNTLWQQPEDGKQ